MNDTTDDAWIAAQNMIDRYGADAWAEAQTRVAELRETSHPEALAFWLRIQELLAPEENDGTPLSPS